MCFEMWILQASFDGESKRGRQTAFHDVLAGRRDDVLVVERESEVLAQGLGCAGDAERSQVMGVLDVWRSTSSRAGVLVCQVNR